MRLGADAWVIVNELPFVADQHAREAEDIALVRLDLVARPVAADDDIARHAVPPSARRLAETDEIAQALLRPRGGMLSPMADLVQWARVSLPRCRMTNRQSPLMLSRAALASDSVAASGEPK